MTHIHFVPLSPLRKALVYPSLVWLCNDCVHEFISRLICLALCVQSVAPVAISGFAIRVDRDRFCEPDAGAVEGVAAILWVGRVISLLEFHISSKQRSL